MQSSARSFEGQPRPARDGLLRCFRAAAWVVVVGAVSPWALAQVAADSTSGEKTGSAGEPQSAAAPDAAPRSEPDAAGPWNRRPSAPTGVDGQLRRLAADLKLDSAQQAKIRAILVARTEEMQRLQRDTRLAPAERRQRVLAIGDRSAEQIRAQLTDAQRAQYIKPRRVTPVAQAGPARRRGGTVVPSAAVPSQGAAQ